MRQKTVSMGDNLIFKLEHARMIHKFIVTLGVADVYLTADIALRIQAVGLPAPMTDGGLLAVHLGRFRADVCLVEMFEGIEHAIQDSCPNNQIMLGQEAESEDFIERRVPKQSLRSKAEWMSKVVTHDGITAPLREHADRLKLHHKTVWTRISQNPSAAVEELLAPAVSRRKRGGAFLFGSKSPRHKPHKVEPSYSKWNPPN